MQADSPKTSRLEIESIEDFLEVYSDFMLGSDAAPAMSEAEAARLYQRVWDGLQVGDHAGVVGDAFRLASHEPWDRDYLLALGCCLQHLEAYEPAAQIYAMAFLLQATDAECAYRIGECLGALEHFQEAREAFETSIELAALTPERTDVREHAMARLNELAPLGA